jgi:ferredoxin-like protein FixX
VKPLAELSEEVVWHGLEDMCVEHGSIRCVCEKTAETEWTDTPSDPNEPF